MKKYGVRWTKIKFIKFKEKISILSEIKTWQEQKGHNQYLFRSEFYHQAGFIDDQGYKI